MIRNVSAGRDLVWCSFLVKNLKVGVKYTFRVWAYSILGVGNVSAPYEYRIPGAVSRFVINFCNKKFHVIACKLFILNPYAATRSLFVLSRLLFDIR